MSIAGSVIISITFVMCLMACNGDDKSLCQWDTIKSEKVVSNMDENIVLQIVEDSLTARGLHMRIVNLSETEITFGRDYFIQIMEKDVWRDIDVKMDWTLELIYVEPEQEYEEEIEWTSFYGELPPGKYRIVKEYEKLGVKSYMYSEFEID